MKEALCLDCLRVYPMPADILANVVAIEKFCTCGGDVFAQPEEQELIAKLRAGAWMAEQTFFKRDILAWDEKDGATLSPWEVDIQANVTPITVRAGVIDFTLNRVFYFAEDDQPPNQ